MYTITCKISCLLVFRLLRYWSSIGRSGRREEEHGKTVKYHITSITPVLQDFADFFSMSLVFNMFLTLMLVEVKLNGI